MTTIHRQIAGLGLSRPQQGRVLGGVCAGLARRLGLDPWLVRVLVIATFVALPGSPFLLYPLAWVLLPEDDAAHAAHAAYPQDRL